MNGYELCERAHIRLGIANEDGFALQKNTSRRDLEFLNQILSDLKIEPLKELSDKIECAPNITEAICCGITMLISFCEGETEKNKHYTSVYNAKRAAVLGVAERVEDTIPTTEGGGI